MGEHNIFLAGKFWQESFGGKVLVGEFWRESFGGKVLVGKFWRESFGRKVLAKVSSLSRKFLA